MDSKVQIMSLYCVRSVIFITERVVFSRAHENYTHTTCFVLDLLLGKKFCSELQSILLQLRSGLLSKISLRPLTPATSFRDPAPEHSGRNGARYSSGSFPCPLQPWSVVQVIRSGKQSLRYQSITSLHKKLKSKIYSKSKCWLDWSSNP